jgi:hypothetical protein
LLSSQLDDPLSALDAGTSKAVFDNLIRGSNALFQTAAVILVTHASHFRNRVDNILLVVGGQSKFCGSWENLTVFEPVDPETRIAVEHIRSSVQEVSMEKKKFEDEYETIHETTRKDGKKDVLMTEEEREQGLSSIKTWLLWFNHAGGLLFIVVQVFLLTMDRFAYVSVEFWLAKWTSGAFDSVDMLGITFDPQTDGRSAQAKYMLVYFLILVISVTFTTLRSEWSVTGGRRAATTVFHSMLVSLHIMFRAIVLPQSEVDTSQSCSGKRAESTHVLL